jgi:hypothetical protein
VPKLFYPQPSINGELKIMAELPTTMPRWYTVEPDKDRGWTPKTSDIIDKRENLDITKAWDGSVAPPPSKRYTARVEKLQVLSPIQVGGGSFPEGGILPAQIAGVPCIPGSSLRGSLLRWVKAQLPQMAAEEQSFWQGLMAPDRRGWQPRQIRFETVWLKDLRPFPLHPQQEWQVFDQKSNKLGIQWQVSSPDKPGINVSRFYAQVLLKSEATAQQRQWVKAQLSQMLEHQGIGRGIASGFGRLALRIPDGRWTIELQGMKPCVQSHSPKDNQTGRYRWSPQVLRAGLRGYFTRLALGLMSQEDALTLTKKVFGGLGCPAQLRLTSYLKRKGRGTGGQDYANIPASVATSTWTIQVDCNREFEELIDRLLSLASRLGGLGPGWRRPPHELNSFNGFRGSEFSVSPQREESLDELIEQLQGMIGELAQRWQIRPNPPSQPVCGGLVSVWQGETEQWRDIVHGVCATKTRNKPDWCGSSQSRPSGYSVRQYEKSCWIAVFDPAVEALLRREGYRQIWQA